MDVLVFLWSAQISFSIARSELFAVIRPRVAVIHHHQPSKQPTDRPTDRPTNQPIHLIDRSVNQCWTFTAFTVHAKLQADEDLDRVVHIKFWQVCYFYNWDKCKSNSSPQCWVVLLTSFRRWSQRFSTQPTSVTLFTRVLIIELEPGSLLWSALKPFRSRSKRRPQVPHDCHVSSLCEIRCMLISYILWCSLFAIGFDGRSTAGA